MEEALVRAGERVDELYRCGYRIIQDPAKFCFGMDAVLLAAFARACPGEAVMDLGTGTGVIPTLMAGRYPGAHYTGLELNRDMAEMAGRSVRLNGLSDTVEIVEGDIRCVRGLFARGSFQAVTANPPYMKQGCALTNPDSARQMARHESCCTLRDCVEAAAYLLPHHGRFYLVHRPGRLPEIFEELRRVRLEPKRMRLVHAFAGSEPQEVLIEASLGGGEGLRVLPPLFEYEAPGVYSAELIELYGNAGAPEKEA